jgi:RNA polymerase sigma factor (sigma-70 family)
VRLVSLSEGASDARLLPFFEAADAEDARRALGELLERHAAPLVQAIVRAKLGVQFQEGEDREDVQAGVLLRLAERLRSLRSGAGPAPPADFTAYVAVTAHNACHAFLRRRHPERARLRNKLRYLLTHHAELALWSGEGRETVCGLATWRGRPASAEAAARIAELRGRVGPFAHGDPARGDASPLAFVDLVLRLVRRAGGALAFEALCASLEEMLGVTPRPRPAAARGDDAPVVSPEAAVPDPRPNPEQAVQQRRSLRRLWDEVRQLPERQRAALLLNLRDADGRGMLGLFPLVGLASIEEIADVIGLAHERFAALWPELPKDDEWIAGELGVTRRQVINFRKCARERLARRLRAAGER